MAVGTLAVNLIANSAKFNSGMTSASKKMGGFQKSAKAVTGQLRTMALAIVSAFSVGKLVGGIKTALTEVDRLAKLSKQLGVSIKDLQTFGLLAELNGLSVESMNKAMQRLTRSIGETNMGTGEASVAFQALGLDAQQLAQMPLSNSFSIIADRISRVGSVAEQATMSYKIFGRQGIELLNVIRQGKSGMDFARQSIEGMGLAIDDIDAGNIENANDAMLLLRTSTVGLFNTLAIALSPAISEMSMNLVDMNTGLAQNSEDMEYLSVKAIQAVNVFKMFGNLIASIGNAIVSLGLAIAKWIAGIGGLFSDTWKQTAIAIEQESNDLWSKAGEQFQNAFNLDNFDEATIRANLQKSNQQIRQNFEASRVAPQLSNDKIEEIMQQIESNTNRMANSWEASE